MVSTCTLSGSEYWYVHVECHCIPHRIWPTFEVASTGALLVSTNVRGKRKLFRPQLFRRNTEENETS